VVSELSKMLREATEALEQAERFPYGPPILQAHENNAKQACVYICDGDVGRGRALWETVKEKCGGYVPAGAALALIHAGLRSNREPYVETPEPS
jgi:hypothetical protein